MPVALSLLLGLAFVSAPPAEVQERARRILKDRDVQTELPSEHRPAKKGQGKEVEPPPRNIDGRARPPRQSANVGASSGMGVVAQGLLWALVIAVVVMLVVWGIRELGGYQKNVAAQAADDAEEQASDDDRARVVKRPLSDADELARQGRYGEAIHALLLRTLKELARRRGALPPHLTSREILTRVRLGDEARLALGDLVTAVEVSHFGGVEPGEGDYRRCLEQFQVFARAYTEGAA